MTVCLVVPKQHQFIIKRKKKRSDCQDPLCDYTAIADRLWKVSWINYSQATGVVNLFTGPTLNRRAIKRTRI